MCRRMRQLGGTCRQQAGDPGSHLLTTTARPGSARWAREPAALAPGPPPARDRPSPTSSDPSPECDARTNVGREHRTLGVPPMKNRTVPGHDSAFLFGASPIENKCTPAPACNHSTTVARAWRASASSCEKGNTVPSDSVAFDGASITVTPPESALSSHGRVKEHGRRPSVSGTAGRARGCSGGFSPCLQPEHR